MQWNGGVYIDTCFQAFQYISRVFSLDCPAKQCIIPHTLPGQFLNDGTPSSLTYQHNLDTIIQICNYLGVPLGLEEVEDPSTALPFLGIVLDTIKMEARLPEEKLSKLREEVSQWISCTEAKKWEILSLVGSLQHAMKVICCGRVFVCCMYATATKLKEMHFHTRLNVEFCSDFCWWHTFLANCKFSLLCWNGSNWILDHLIQTDASGAWGCGMTNNFNGGGHEPTITLWWRNWFQ